jgi:uncharacterized protein
VNFSSISTIPTGNRMKIVGVDLSGPTNTAETALVWFRVEGDELIYEGSQVGATDGEIYELALSLAARSDLIFGIDAPLSYQPGGGDRLADTELRRNLIHAGLPSGVVMAPTMTRMAYLTLRGISIARFLSELTLNNIKIVEVHPAGSMVLRGADSQTIRGMKTHIEARKQLLTWIEEQRVTGAGQLNPDSSHLVAACASALAAWKWSIGDTVWIKTAAPPFHPFDFAC